MRYKLGEIIVVALGGSVVYPDAVDVAFLKKFRAFVLRNVKKGKKFVIVQGGGQLCRIFQAAAGAVVPLTDREKDWVGIYSTHLNARLIQAIFRRMADPVLIDSQHKLKKLKYPVTVAAGWQPGWSTDFVAAALAADFGVPEFVVAGKPDHVYTKNPDTHKDAKPFDTISWRAYRKLVPARWVPGSHAPVDPVAARFAENRKLKAIVLDGRNLNNVERLLKGGEFRGTLIE